VLFAHCSSAGQEPADAVAGARCLASYVAISYGVTSVVAVAVLLSG
jgi:hypothetical protein